MRADAGPIGSDAATSTPGSWGNSLPKSYARIIFTDAVRWRKFFAHCCMKSVTSASAGALLLRKFFTKLSCP